jgi:DNA-binding MarR family transcriptional regulator
MTLVDTFPTHLIVKQNLLCQLAKTCRSSRLLASDALAHLGLHPGQEMILFALWEQDGLTQNQLAERLEVQPPTISKMLQRLGERQPSFIERRTCPRDQRVTKVFLSTEGKAQQTVICAQWQHLEQQLFIGLSEAETLLFKRLLTQIHHNAQQPLTAFINAESTANPQQQHPHSHIPNDPSKT